MEQLSNIQQINSQIMFGSLTNEQLNSILGAVKFRRAQINKETKRSLMLGDVVKINIKNVKVRDGITTWNVPANMLTVTE